MVEQSVMLARRRIGLPGHGHFSPLAHADRCVFKSLAHVGRPLVARVRPVRLQCLLVVRRQAPRLQLLTLLRFGHEHHGAVTVGSGLLLLGTLRVQLLVEAIVVVQGDAERTAIVELKQLLESAVVTNTHRRHGENNGLLPV